MENNYKDEKNIELRKKINLILQELPPFCTEYIEGRELSLAEYTMLSYIYKIRLYLKYLVTHDTYCMNKDIKDITLEDLSHIDSTDINHFTHWLKTHLLQAEKGTQKMDKKITIENYIACLNAFWIFFCKREVFTNNPFTIIDRYSPPKDKHIIRLKGSEQDNFLDTVEFGTGLTERQQVFHEKNQIRDIAICRIFLFTGVRVSELVGLNLENIDFENHCLYIIRKGHKFDDVYFDDDTESYLMEYLNIRENYHPPEDEPAVFLNKNGLRMGVRSIQKLVRKYADTSLPRKMDKITPHKLRATYASNMLNESGNLALVQSQLGHNEPSTTRIYSEVETKIKKQHRNALTRSEGGNNE